MTIGIKSIASYLPPKTLTSRELSERFDFDLAFLEEKVGIITRHVCPPEMAVSDMGVAAVQSLFKRNPELSPKTIHLLVVCTQTPDHQIPHTAALMQDRLGLPRVAAFDLNLACSGFVYGLGICQALMQAQGWKKALLVTTEAYSKIMAQGDRDTMALFGDGATATWLGPEPLCHTGAVTYGTDGSGAEALMVRQGGSREPWLPQEPVAARGDWGRLTMDGKGIFEFVMRTLPAEIQRCLDANDLSKDDIDWFLFHQASKYVLDFLAKRAGIPGEKMVYALEDVANTVSSTIPMALEGLIEGGGMAGKKVFISGFGGGLSWASTVLQFLDSEEA